MPVEECEEARCARAATKDWNGRKVCEDHYDMYRDQHDSMLKDLE